MTENIDFQLEPLLVESEKFHGHLGPFLVIGLKAGLVGLKELNAQRGNRDLFVRVLCEDEIPFTCALDGLQFSTGCTTGNKRLSFKKSLRMVIEVKNNERTIRMILNHIVFESLRAKLLGKKFQNKKLRELAYEIAKMEENRLFSIEYY